MTNKHPAASEFTDNLLIPGETVMNNSSIGTLFLLPKETLKSRLQLPKQTFLRFLFTIRLKPVTPKKSLPIHRIDLS
jgi:hypothetical protein